MPQTLSEATRVARKPHWCGMCNGVIAVGDQYHVSSNVYDGSVYDWRTCGPCDQTGVLAFVYDWAGSPDEGVGYDSAVEWSAEAERWAMSDSEIHAARLFRERTAAARETAEEAS